jgi:hypothetical protein
MGQIRAPARVIFDSGNATVRQSTFLPSCEPLSDCHLHLRQENLIALSSSSIWLGKASEEPDMRSVASTRGRPGWVAELSRSR